MSIDKKREDEEKQQIKEAKLWKPVFVLKITWEFVMVKVKLSWKAVHINTCLILKIYEHFPCKRDKQARSSAKGDGPKMHFSEFCFSPHPLLLSEHVVAHASTS